MRNRDLSNFLEKERATLAKRRQIFGIPFPNSSGPSQCRNATFSTENEALEAGFDSVQCGLILDCKEDCQCQKRVCDVARETCSECQQIEEEICGEENVPETVKNLQNYL